MLRAGWAGLTLNKQDNNQIESSPGHCMIQNFSDYIDFIFAMTLSNKSSDNERSYFSYFYDKEVVEYAINTFVISLVQSTSC